MNHLSGLNEAQKQAVLTTEGPVLVLAGAGAGKTRTIAHRIVHIVKSGTPGNAILAITFTNKAAREMRERVVALLEEHGEGRAARGTTILTFHALCVQILREFHREAGVSRYFTIYDRADSLRAVKKALKDAGEEGVEPRMVLSGISRAKGDAQTLDTYREAAGHAYFPLIVADAWARYDATVRKDGSLDFDDLLLLTWRLLREHPEVRATLEHRYRYIHVDEYQDTNKVQYEIVRMLGGDTPNLFCVGDLDQNVYSWRGSTIENILEFEHSFPHATILRLEQNYRSTKTIVAVSNEVIKKNKRRKEKMVFTENSDGQKLRLLLGFDERNEADTVVGVVEELRERGVPLHEIAVLYRANFQSRVLEEAFLAAGIPHRVLGTRFFERREVKDVLSYIRAALNPDSSADMLRIINTPARGIGKTTVAELERVGRSGLTGAARTKIDAFFAILDDIRTRTSAHTASQVLAFTLERSGIAKHLSGGTEEDRERLENVKELVSLAVERYDALPAPDGLLKLLEDSSLMSDQDELDRRTDRARDGVVLMTIHAAKGLEFAHVFITGLEDGLFPHDRTEEPGTRVDDEEERRLFYVALTRAKERVYLSYAQVRTVFGVRVPRMPSEFLLEIDESYIETDAATTERREKVIYLD